MFKKIGSKLKEQKGFTLIELLAVIVILGIIAAIAIPAIGNVINNSKEKSKVQEALQIINAAKLYVADENTIDDTTGVGYDDLQDYLDRVKDKDFTVKVQADASGVVSYTITGHEANDDLDTVDATATEQELADWTK